LADEGQSWLGRWFGGDASWWRVIATGIAGGLVLALLAALVVGLIGGDSGSLDDSEPTAIAPGEGPVIPIDTEPPLETFLPPPTEIPIEEPLPTFAPEPTATEVILPPPTEFAPTPAATFPVETPLP